MSGPTALTMAAAAEYTNGLPKHASTDDSGIRKKNDRAPKSRKKNDRAPKRTVMSKSLSVSVTPISSVPVNLNVEAVCACLCCLLEPRCDAQKISLDDGRRCLESACSFDRLRRFEREDQKPESEAHKTAREAENPEF